ncbi:hypothetical protein WJX82_008796 [Trebouxia sp. C0006]
MHTRLHKSRGSPTWLTGNRGLVVKALLGSLAGTNLEAKHKAKLHGRSLAKRNSLGKALIRTMTRSSYTSAAKALLLHAGYWQEADVIEKKGRELLVYTNTGSDGGFRKMKRMWDSQPFKHPATFNTLALDTKLKQAVMQKLDSFSSDAAFYRGSEMRILDQS